MRVNASLEGVVIQIKLSERLRTVHRRDAENTEDAQRVEYFFLCASVVNNPFTYTQFEADL
jgi:hypothetical protein